MSALTNTVSLTAILLLLLLTHKLIASHTKKRSQPGWILLTWLIAFALVATSISSFTALLAVQLVAFVLLSTLLYRLLTQIKPTALGIFSISSACFCLISFYMFGDLDIKPSKPEISSLHEIANQACYCPEDDLQECLSESDQLLVKLLSVKALEGYISSNSLKELSLSKECIAARREKTDRAKNSALALVDQWEQEIQAHKPASTPAQQQTFFTPITSWLKSWFSPAKPAAPAVANTSSEKTITETIKTGKAHIKNKELADNKDKSQESDTAVADKAIPSIPTFESVSLDDLEAFNGFTTKLTKKNGIELNGILVLKNNEIIIKTKQGTGYALLPIAKTKIAQLKVRRQLTIAEQRTPHAYDTESEQNIEKNKPGLLPRKKGKFHLPSPKEKD